MTAAPQPHTDAESRSSDPRRAALYASLVEDAFDFMVTLRADFTISFASGGITALLGLEPEAYVDRTIAEVIHPDDLARAYMNMEGWEEAGAPAGTTMFRILAADGSYCPFDVTGARVFDGERHHLAVYCRPVNYQLATDEVLRQLLTGGSRAAALKTTLDVFAWEYNNTHVSYAWYEAETGHQFVTTGLPRELTGAEDEPGPAWTEARATGQPVLVADGTRLDPDRVAAAQALTRGGYWVVPVPDGGSGVPALVTVWVAANAGRPEWHSYGMTLAQSYIELILRWTNQVASLNEAARRDPLTGVGNRNTLFEAISAGIDGGALLYCDLDHFKPINDAHGHAAGDAVLLEVATRIQLALGPNDLLARTGGDEFVVVSPGSTVADADRLAEAIRSAVSEPIASASPTLNVGMTIGVAHAPERLTEQLLARADRALIEAKREARGTVRWAQSASSDTSTA